MSVSVDDVHKGLAGVVADRTAISQVVPETNSLTYRGYAVQDLAAACSFEEVAYLIWHGELPMPAQLRQFEAAERAARDLDLKTLAQISQLPETCHPMDMLRTAVSCLGANDPGSDDNHPQANQAKALRLLARLPTVLSHHYRRRRGLPRIPPQSDLGFAENFFYMCFERIPPAEVVRSFEISLILYAEHGFNASTFAARVIVSSLSDIYSAVTGAIGALKGPLHGGANEAVMRMMLEIDDPARASAWLRSELAAGRRVMGFGHRVYRNGDSRVPTMKDALSRLSQRSGQSKWISMYEELERAMFEEKGIRPNLDFPTAPAYYLMGFDIPLFTPIFVLSRTAGWTAHIMEQLAANSLIRPLAQYAGVAQRPLPERRQ